jgi:hypothetical protein
MASELLQHQKPDFGLGLSVSTLINRLRRKSKFWIASIGFDRPTHPILFLLTGKA